MPTAFGYEAGALEGKKGFSVETYKAAITLCGITLVAGLALGGAYQLTKAPIERAEEEAAKAAYVSVCPDADSFEDSENLLAAIEQLTADDGTVAGGEYGNVVYESVYDALDAGGNVVGYVVNVTSKDGFGGEVTVSVGIRADRSVSGIEFLTINETAGLGMKATEDAFKGQYVGDEPIDKFELVKEAAASENQIEAISGATITSTAVTNAVNAALQLVGSAAE
ncbi:MAG: RnfABCDGE type electron transport complex subunit G [Eubacteriales bacterium]|nr:RnfABCDGE type electron transport complex subunit G [Eubacteriales bacterium]